MSSIVSTELVLLADISLPVVPFSLIVIVALIALAVFLLIQTGWILSSRKERGIVSRPGNISTLAYVGFVISVFVLSATSFYSIVMFGKMEHYALLMHMGAAGAFVFLITFVAIRFSPGLSTEDRMTKEIERGANRWWQFRWSMWLILVGGLLSALTMLLSMLPVLSTEQMEIAIGVHRYAGLACFLGVVWHLYSMVWLRLGHR